MPRKSEVDPSQFKELRPYTASDLFRAIVGRLQAHKDLISFNPKRPPKWKDIAYLENKDYILFKFATDSEDDNFFSTIKEVLNAYPKDKPGKLMIFPIGLRRFGRRHWVTLVYDPKRRKACIIDSRPWYISVWYPTSAIKQMLGARSVSHVYQGVQPGGIYCGAWTSANIAHIINLRLTKIAEIKAVLSQAFDSSQQEAIYLEHPTVRELHYINQQTKRNRQQKKIARVSESTQHSTSFSLQQRGASHSDASSSENPEFYRLFSGVLLQQSDDSCSSDKSSTMKPI